MGVIWTKQVQTKPTSVKQLINRKNPLTTGLVRLYAPTGREYLGTSSGLISLGSLSSLVTNKLVNSSSSGSAPTIGAIGNFAGATAYTMLCIATPNSLTTRMPLMGYNDATDTLPFGFGTGYSNSDQVFAYLDGTNYVAESIPGYFVVGQRNVYALTASSAAGLTYYKNKVGTSGTIVGSFVAAPTTLSLTAGGGGLNGGIRSWDGSIELVAYWTRVLNQSEISQIVDNPWQLFEGNSVPLVFTASSGTTVTGIGSSSGTGIATGTGASTTAAAGSSSGIGTATGVGSSSSSGSGVGSASGTGSATGTGASTAASTGSASGIGTATGIGASTAASTGSASGIGTATGVGANGTVTTSAVGSASGSSTVLGVSPSHGGGTGKGQNLSRKQKKKLKAVESQEWLKAEETARQLLNDRFTKQTPQEKAEALQTHVESLQPVIDALKELVPKESKTKAEIPSEVNIETEHQQIIKRFDMLITKMSSIEELLVIMLADL